MKTKIIFASILTLVFGYAFVAQTYPVSAKKIETPTPTPITSPATGPVTGPITFAGFKLSGKVTYRNLGRIWKSLGKVVPAVGVQVTAINRSTGTTANTTTDSNGDYLFILPEAKYKVDVDAQGFFVPPFRMVNLKKDKDGVNFQGLNFSH